MLISAILLAALCWHLARWTWEACAPAAEASIESVPRSADLRAAQDTVIAARLFNRAGSTGKPAMEIGAATTLNLKLGGLAASHGAKESYAVLNLNNKGNEVITRGGEITPGVTLEEVLRDRVVIRRQGVLERIDLVDVKREATTTRSFNLGVQKQGAGNYNFSRGELNRALQDPAQIAQLGTLTVQPGTGVNIEQAAEGSLTQKLGLMPGDRITKVNGETVSTQDDLLRLYQQFAKVGQITLEGTRAGAPLQLKYGVQP